MSDFSEYMNPPESDYIKRVEAIQIAWCYVDNRDMIDELEELPTADVVEVVRCKDCVYGEIDNKDFPTQYLCNHQGCDWNDKNHFCSYGEVKDEQIH